MWEGDAPPHYVKGVRTEILKKKENDDIIDKSLTELYHFQLSKRRWKVLYTAEEYNFNNFAEKKEIPNIMFKFRTSIKILT